MMVSDRNICWGSLCWLGPWLGCEHSFQLMGSCTRVRKLQSCCCHFCAVVGRQGREGRVKNSIRVERDSIKVERDSSCLAPVQLPTSWKLCQCCSREKARGQGTRSSSKKGTAGSCPAPSSSLLLA